MRIIFTIEGVNEPSWLVGLLAWRLVASELGFRIGNNLLSSLGTKLLPFVECIGLLDVRWIYIEYLSDKVERIYLLDLPNSV